MLGHVRYASVVKIFTVLKLVDQYKLYKVVLILCACAIIHSFYLLPVHLSQDELGGGKEGN